MFWNKFPGQKYHTWFIQCANANMHFQFLKRTFCRLLITGLTLYWKYHTPNESKLLYCGCLASFENRKCCIKLSKRHSWKNIDISDFFSGIGFQFFSNTATAYRYLLRTWRPDKTPYGFSSRSDASVCMYSVAVRQSTAAGATAYFVEAGVGKLRETKLWKIISFILKLELP